MNAIFKNRVFLIVLGTDLLEQLGMWIRNMALLFFIMEKSNNNPIAVSLLMVLEYLPIFLFSFIGGTLADRWNPKRTMVMGDLLSAASIIVILALIGLGYWQALFAAALVSAAVSQFAQPSGAKVLKRHVPDEVLTQAVSITQSISALFLIVGPAAGTAIYVNLGLYPSLFVMLGLFLLSALLLLFLPAQKTPERVERASIIGEIREGFRYITGNANLKTILVMHLLLGIGSGLIAPLEIFLITDRLHLPKESVQWLATMSGIGLLVGGVVASLLSERVNRKLVASVAIGICAFAIAGEAYSVWFPLTAALRFVGGICLAFLEIMLGAYMIKLVEEKFIGRVNGMVAPLFTAVMLIGSSIAGPLMVVTSLLTVFTVAAAFILLAAAVIPRLQMETEGKEVG